MKRFFVLVFIGIVLCVNPIRAQYDKGSWYFRPYAGFLFSTLQSKSFEKGYDPKLKFNMTFGGQFEWQAMTNSSLLLDVNYRRQGCSFDYKDVTKSEWADYVVEVNKLTIDYIGIGAQWKMYFKPNFSARIGLELMVPTSGLKAHAHAYGKMAYYPENPGLYSSDDDVSKYVWEEFDEHETEKIKSDIDDGGFCIPLGLSYEYKNFTINATYRLDMNRIFDTIDELSEEPQYSVFSSSKNQMYFHEFDITVGYNIPLKKGKK